MTETTLRIEQMTEALNTAFRALETAENREGNARASWLAQAAQEQQLASTLALASIAESLAALVGIALQVDDDISRVAEAVEALRAVEA